MNKFERVKYIIGSENLRAFNHTSVILFGAGGVGSWCAEALIRSGIGHLTIVDPDKIEITNINRQIQATIDTIGKVKVYELSERLKRINPEAEIVPLQKEYNKDTVSLFDLKKFDYVIDAIDSLSSKVELIINATAANVTLFTSLGAAGWVHPSFIKIRPLMESCGCRLGRMLRKRLRQRGYKGNPLCVYSEEGAFPSPKNLNYKCNYSSVKNEHNDLLFNKMPKGSFVHITGTFGFFLAGLVIMDVLNKRK
ncbi:MAG: tRNA threonylcarbamoyladenosine dehydratase [Chitinispirillaceae bacterium]|nr:tRNA threonylcarbamoyladenosine dehydratase [Chitinispirillaceae bacterium]